MRLTPSHPSSLHQPSFSFLFSFCFCFSLWNFLRMRARKRNRMSGLQEPSAAAERSRGHPNSQAVRSPSEVEGRYGPWLVLPHANTASPPTPLQRRGELGRFGTPRHSPSSNPHSHSVSRSGIFLRMRARKRKRNRMSGLTPYP